MKTLSVQEAETQFMFFLMEIEQKGETFVICRNGMPVAEFAPYRRKSRLTPHPVISRITLHYNPTESLTQDEWPAMAFR